MFIVCEVDEQNVPLRIVRANAQLGTHQFFREYGQGEVVRKALTGRHHPKLRFKTIAVASLNLEALLEKSV